MFLLLLLALIPQLCFAAFDGNSHDNVVAYWGSAADQESLGTYCERKNIDVVLISFLNYVTVDHIEGNFGNSCGGPNQYCPQVEEDIIKCQQLGIKVLLSIGGGNNVTFLVNSTEEGQKAAKTMYNTFHPQGSAAIKPFGKAEIDGFDLDLESWDGCQNKLSSNHDGQISLYKNLRSIWTTKTLVLSAAPQCVYPDKQVGDLLVSKEVDLDIIFVQFYSSYSCFISNDGFADSLTQWKNLFTTELKDRKAKFYPGVQGYPENFYTNGYSEYYSPIKTVYEKLASFRGTSYLGGFGLFDVTGATKHIDTLPGEDSSMKYIDAFYDFAKGYTTDAITKTTAWTGDSTTTSTESYNSVVLTKTVYVKTPGADISSLTKSSSASSTSAAKSSSSTSKSSTSTSASSSLTSESSTSTSKSSTSTSASSSLTSESSTSASKSATSTSKSSTSTSESSTSNSKSSTSTSASSSLTSESSISTSKSSTSASKSSTSTSKSSTSTSKSSTSTSESSSSNPESLISNSTSEYSLYNESNTKYSLESPGIPINTEYTNASSLKLAEPTSTVYPSSKIAGIKQVPTTSGLIGATVSVSNTKYSEISQATIKLSITSESSDQSRAFDSSHATTVYDVTTTYVPFFKPSDDSVVVIETVTVLDQETVTVINTATIVETHFQTLAAEALTVYKAEYSSEGNVVTTEGTLQSEYTAVHQSSEMSTNSLFIADFQAASPFEKNAVSSTMKSSIWNGDSSSNSYVAKESDDEVSQTGTNSSGLFFENSGYRNSLKMVSNFSICTLILLVFI